jgi:hypothetical protein
MTQNNPLRTCEGAMRLCQPFASGDAAAVDSSRSSSVEIKAMADDLDKSQEYLAAKRQFADFLEKDVRKNPFNQSLLVHN